MSGLGNILDILVVQLKIYMTIPRKKISSEKNRERFNLGNGNAREHSVKSENV